MQLVVTSALPKSVLPLFLVTATDAFIQFGSASFVRFDNAFFLLTAAHVVAGQNGNDNLMMQGLGGYLRETPDRWQRTMPEKGAPLKADRNDIAVSLLTEEMVAGLFEQGYDCLDGSTIDPLPVLEGETVAFTGYPGEEQACLHFADVSFVHLRPVGFHTTVARPSQAISSGFGCRL